jgi:hypothetical protein
MADTATVEVEDEAVVTIDIGDEDTGTEGTPGKKAENGTGAEVGKTAADEAADALKKSLEESKRRENAALATAEAERRRADQEAARANSKDREAQVARETATSTQLTVITNRIDSAKRDLDAAKAEFRVAHEAGDVDKMADAQAKIGTAAAQIDRYSTDKENFEAAAAARAEQAEAVDTTSRSVNNVDTYIERGKYAPAAAAFLRAHADCLPPEYGGTVEKNAAMMAGHYDAMAKKIPVNSEKYFETIEAHLNGGPVSAAAETRKAGDEGATAGAQQQRRAPVPSAPPSRDPPLADGTPTGKQTIRLDTAQQEMALLSYPQKQGEDDRVWKKRAFGTYANELVVAKKLGIIGRQTH